MRIALLGCGRIGRMHADNLMRHPHADLAMVHDIHPPSAEEVSSQHGVPVARDADQVFSSADVDAVLVASSTETHVTYIEMAVTAGKPVLCEKPIHLDLARVNLCAERIRGTKVPIQIGFNRRFDPGHRAARQGGNGWRDWRSAPGCHHVSRSLHAAKGVLRGGRRPASRHDHPRLRSRPFHAG